MKWRIETVGEQSKIYRYGKLVHEYSRYDANKLVQMAIEDEKHPNY